MGKVIGGTDVFKHRDYRHNSVWSHLKAEGAESDEIRPVQVIIDPITEEPKDKPETYMLVGIKLDKTVYEYLIATKEAGKVTDKDIEAALDLYARNPVSFGRNWRDYADPESELDILIEEQG